MHFKKNTIIRNNIKILYRFYGVEIIKGAPHFHWFTNKHRVPNSETSSGFNSGEESELAGQPAIIKLPNLMPHQPVLKSYSGTEIKVTHNVKNKLHIHKHSFHIK